MLASRHSSLHLEDPIQTETNEFEVFKLPEILKPYQNIEGQIFRFQRRVRTQKTLKPAIEKSIEWTSSESTKLSLQWIDSTPTPSNKSGLFDVKPNIQVRSPLASSSKDAFTNERLFPSIRNSDQPSFERTSPGKNRLKTFLNDPFVNPVNFEEAEQRVKDKYVQKPREPNTSDFSGFSRKRLGLRTLKTVPPLDDETDTICLTRLKSPTQQQCEPRSRILPLLQSPFNRNYTGKQ